MIRDIHGIYCPMGCGPSLHLMDGGMIQCLAAKCPDPGAAQKILADREHLDIVEFTDTGFTITHPLRERLTGLSSCPVLRLCNELTELPDGKLGRYRTAITQYGMDLKEIED